MNNRNSIIEIIRFIGAMAIANGHYINRIGEGIKLPSIPSAYYVDYFAVLIAFFMSKEVEKISINCVNNSQDNKKFNYIKNRIILLYKKILPYNVIATIILYIGFVFKRHIFDIKLLFNELMNFIFEIFFMTQFLPFNSTVKQSQLWFLSYVVISIPLICIILFSKYKKEILVLMIFPSIMIIRKFSCDTVLYRIVNGMVIGCMAKELLNMINRKNGRLSVKIINTIYILSILLFIFININGIDNYYFTIIVFILIIVLSFYENNLFVINNSVLNYFGRISMIIYIIHNAILAIMYNIKCENLIKNILYLIFCIVCSILLYEIFKYIKKYKVKANI